MKAKIAISILFLLITQFKSFAQDSSQSFLTKSILGVMSFIKEVDRSISEINDREELKKVYRILGDVTLDLQEVTIQKSKLGNQIVNKLDSPPTNEIQKEIDALIVNITFLRKSFMDLVPYVIQAHQDDLVSIVNSLDKVFEPNVSRWNSIKNFAFDKKQLLAEIEASNKLNRDAAIILNDIRKKIRDKLQ